MRISEQQKQDISNTVQSFITAPFFLYLVGSRTKDHLKGGDIDLLLILNNEDIEPFLEIKYKIVNAIMAMSSIDETKIDLIFATKEDLLNDPFISTLNDGKILLGTPN